MIPFTNSPHFEARFAKNLSMLEPPIEKHYALKKTCIDLKCLESISNYDTDNFAKFCQVSRICRNELFWHFCTLLTYNLHTRLVLSNFFCRFLASLSSLTSGSNFMVIQPAIQGAVHHHLYLPASLCHNIYL